MGTAEISRGASFQFLGRPCMSSKSRLATAADLRARLIMPPANHGCPALQGRANEHLQACNCWWIYLPCRPAAAFHMEHEALTAEHECFACCGKAEQCIILPKPGTIRLWSQGPASNYTCILQEPSMQLRPAFFGGMCHICPSVAAIRPSKSWTRTKALIP